MVTLPRDILYPIVTSYICDSSTTLHNALSLRLLSRDINLEVLHQLFTIGHIEPKIAVKRHDHNHRHSVCVTCRIPIRPERRDRAINRTTVQRYLVGWLSRDIGASPNSLRSEVWNSLNEAVGRYEAMKERLYPASVPETDLTNSSTTTSETPSNETLQTLVDAIIMLYGVRYAWANFGPHITTCREYEAHWPLGRMHHQTKIFWCLIIAVYNGNSAMVQKFLESLDVTKDGEWGANVVESQMVDLQTFILDQWLEGPKADEAQRWKKQTTSLAAALTIAVRRGHASIISSILRSGMTRTVCCDVRFWNRRTVIGTLFAATADSDLSIAEIAVSTIQTLLHQWKMVGLWAKDQNWFVDHLRCALDIPTQSGILLEVLEALLSFLPANRMNSDILGRLQIQILCQAAMKDDMDRAKLAVELRQSKSRIRSRYETSHHNDCFTLNPWVETDEYGVRCERILSIINPFRIAAALNHTAILEWLLTKGWDTTTLKMYKPWQLKARDSKTYKKFQQKHECYRESTTMVNFVREAVHDVFLYPERLPVPLRANNNLESLNVILTRSQSYDWTEELNCAACMSKRAILESFANAMNLKGDRRRIYDESIFGNRGAPPGFKALQRALRSNQFDNARDLVSRDVILTKPVRGSAFFDDDPAGEELLKTLPKEKIPGMRLVTRKMTVLYWVDGDEESSAIDDLRTARTIEEEYQASIKPRNTKVGRYLASRWS